MSSEPPIDETPREPVEPLDEARESEAPLRMDELYAELELELAAEAAPRAWLRNRPTGQRLALAALGVASVTLAGAVAPRPHLADLPLSFWLLVAGALGVALTVAVRLVLQPAQERGPTASERYGTAMAAVLVPMALAVATSNPTAEACYGLLCLLTGVAFALPAYGLVRLLDRQPDASGHRWLAAGVAGLAAYAALTLRCPGEHLTHLLVGHASAGALIALGATGLARLVRARA